MNEEKNLDFNKNKTWDRIWSGFGIKMESRARIGIKTMPIHKVHPQNVQLHDVQLQNVQLQNVKL
jgi:hypothetical protein